MFFEKIVIVQQELVTNKFFGQIKYLFSIDQIKTSLEKWVPLENVSHDLIVIYFDLKKTCQHERLCR